jgi:hypothetical protein
MAHRRPTRQSTRTLRDEAAQRLLLSTLDLTSMTGTGDRNKRFSLWWDKFTHGGKFSEIAVAVISLIWCFIWFALAFLIPEPRGESSLFWVLYILICIGGLVGIVATAIAFSKATQEWGS